MTQTIDWSRFTPSDEEQKAGIVTKNAVRCGICGASADRLTHLFQCQKVPGHIADFNTGIFSDCSYPDGKEND